MEFFFQEKRSINFQVGNDEEQSSYTQSTNDSLKAYRLRFIFTTVSPHFHGKKMRVNIFDMSTT